MDVIREAGSGRLRASLRGALPAVVTLAGLVAGLAALGRLLASTAEAGTAGGVLLAYGVQGILYAMLIVVAIWSAARLERRDWSAFGLNVDASWGRDFLAGAVASLVGIALSLWWADSRGIRAVDLAAVQIRGPDEPLALGAVLAVFVGYFLLGNVYEEVVYRRIVLGNFLEGLVGRGVSAGAAAALASATSLLLFGLYHVPLRGNVVVAVDAALVGIPFALAYLLTGDLGLATGVHFGRVSIEFLHGRVALGAFEVPAAVAITQDTLTANLEFKLLRVGLVCLGVIVWVALTRGRLRLAGLPGRQVDAREPTE